MTFIYTICLAVQKQLAKAATNRALTFGGDHVGLDIKADVGPRDWCNNW